MGPSDVFYDRRGILRFLSFLHYRHHRAQFLAYQSFCGCNYEYVCRYQGGDEKECFWCCSVSVSLFKLYSELTRLYRLVPIEKDGQDDGWLIIQGRKTSNVFKTIYNYSSWIWVILALTSLVLQATRTVTISPTHALVLYFGELAITFAFDAEMVLRVLASLPEWRSFFEHGNNWIDGVLAIGCTIIQIPAIVNSNVYPWFTIFQLARFYRVILVVPRMKPLLVGYRLLVLLKYFH